MNGCFGCANSSPMYSYQGQRMRVYCKAQKTILAEVDDCPLYEQVELTHLVARDFAEIDARKEE